MAGTGSPPAGVRSTEKSQPSGVSAAAIQRMTTLLSDRRTGPNSPLRSPAKPARYGLRARLEAGRHQEGIGLEAGGHPALVEARRHRAIGIPHQVPALAVHEHRPQADQHADIGPQHGSDQVIEAWPCAQPETAGAWRPSRRPRRPAPRRGPASVAPSAAAGRGRCDGRRRRWAAGRDGLRGRDRLQQQAAGQQGDGKQQRDGSEYRSHPPWTVQRAEVSHRPGRHRFDVERTLYP